MTQLLLELVLVISIFVIAACESSTGPEKKVALVITSQPSGAMTFVNDNLLDDLTPCTTDVVPGEYYSVRLQLAKYFPWDITYLVNSDGKNTISARFQPTPNFKIAYSASDTVWTIGLDGLNPNAFIDSSYDGKNLLWSPDGKYLSYLSNNGEIIILNKDKTLKEKLNFIRFNRADDFSWSHSSQVQLNGVYGGLGNDHEGGIYAYDVISDEFKRILRTGGYTYDHNPVFSPDNSRIAYIHHEYEYLAWIKLMNADGNNFHKITDTLYTGSDEHLYLNWFSDKELLFKIYSKGIYLLTFNPNTNDLAKIGKVVDATGDYYGIGKLRVSPNHLYYAYAADKIYFAPIGNWSPVLLPALHVKDFVWSPSSEAIIYTGKNEGDNAMDYYSGIFWVYLDGTKYCVIKGKYSGVLSIAPN